MKWLWWAIIQFTWCPYKREIWTKTQREGRRCKPRNAKDCCPLPEARKRQRKSLRRVSEVAQLCWHLDLALTASAIMGQYTFSVSSHPKFVVLCYSNYQNNIQSIAHHETLSLWNTSGKIHREYNSLFLINKYFYFKMFLVRDTLLLQKLHLFIMKYVKTDKWSELVLSLYSIFSTERLKWTS